MTQIKQNHGKIMDQILAYENGEMSDEQMITFFQKLIDTGQAWQLQGGYGRKAMQLIEDGFCTLGEKGYRDAYGNYVPSKHEVKRGRQGSWESYQQMQVQRHAKTQSARAA